MRMIGYDWNDIGTNLVCDPEMPPPSKGEHVLVGDEELVAEVEVLGDAVRTARCWLAPFDRNVPPDRYREPTPKEIDELKRANDWLWRD